MKHIILTLLIVFTSTLCSAQTEHVKFKGIPMEGTLNSFVTKLKAKGFTYIGQEDGMAVLKGEFATMKGCTVAVARFSDKDQVNLVAVRLPEAEVWSELYSQYSSFKEMLTEKYGTPECIEEFADKEPINDFLRFHAVLDGECHYVCRFSCDGGKVELTMRKADYNSASVILRYIDKTNAEETRKKVMEDL